MQSILKTNGFDALRFVLRLVTGNVQKFRIFARRRTVAAFWLSVIGLLVLMSVAAPVFAPSDPYKPDFTKVTLGPNTDNLFGTDFLGWDQVSRIV